MRKKDLQKIKHLTATPKIMELVKQDAGETKTAQFTYKSNKTYRIYERYQYYRAVVENEILKLAVFPRRCLAAGIVEPEYEIYLDKREKKYLTYDPSQGRWLTGKIDSLKYDLDTGYWYGNKPWASENTKKIVNDYLETGSMEVKEAVLEFQNKVGKERLERKHRTEIEEIDAVMNTVPELPKDFDNWILESAFIHERYLLYHYQDKENRAYCTHCGKTVKLSKTPKHNTDGICPSCKTKAMIKAWKKQKYLIDGKKVGIIQKLTDGSGYVLRRFYCRIERKQENDYRIKFAGCWENERFILNENFHEKGRYEFGLYKQTGITRWCHDRGNYYYVAEKDECVLYHRNLKNLRKGTEFRYVPLEELFSHNQGCYSYTIRILSEIRRKPQIEYLIKTHLYRLAWDLAKTVGKDITDPTKKKLWQALKITKEQLTDCIKMNISARELDTLQRANELRIKLTREQIRFFTEEIGSQLSVEIFKYKHPGKFERYFKRLGQEKQRIADYMDYLQDVEKLRLTPTEDILFPKNFTAAHQRTALQRQEREDKMEHMKILEKEKLLEQMLPELREIYEYGDNDFMIILPTCKADFNREGRENHNCVGGSYFDKMIKGESCVMFLRKKEDPNTAFCTVEMKGSSIKQCRAIYNRTAPEDAEKFMEKFSKEVEHRIQKKRKELRIQAAV
ncbi:MAG: PcfJ domain-containing protein [Lachnospiraceae bacterium]|nr:PcfJ domain-containing protein [Lachnospiraceae bacterium]